MCPLRLVFLRARTRSDFKFSMFIMENAQKLEDVHPGERWPNSYHEKGDGLLTTIIIGVVTSDISCNIVIFAATSRPASIWPKSKSL